jgi:hypothetical protein
MNDGQCSLVNTNKYACTCVNGFTGINCNKKIFNSTIFKNSSILTQEQSLSLNQILNFTNSNTSFNLIYQATRDGFGLKDFHSKCDGILNTLMIIKTRDSYVFGGFTTKDWSQVSGFQEDSNAFIFSLINPFNRPVKMNIVENSSAIYSGQDYINRFYDGILGFGLEFLLNDYSNKYKNYAWPAADSLYQIPDFIDDITSLNNKQTEFLADEIELYTVNINRNYIFCSIIYF